MANLEVLALDATTPQIRAPGVGDGYSVPRNMTMAAGTTLAAQAVTATTGTLSGNLTFSSTAQRITGDMSNATESNRLAFQTSTTNGATVISAIPNGTGTASTLDLYSSNDPTNSAYFRIQSFTSTVGLNSAITGTGSYKAMSFLTGGSERMRLDTSGNLGIGTTSPGTRLTVAASVEAGARFLGNGLTSLGLFVGYNSAAYVYNDSNTPMIFGTNATERMRIDSSGNVGIGTTSPSTNLDVGGGSGSVSVRINGGASGTGNGANIYLSNNGSVVGTLGNPSVPYGGAFDNSIALTGYYGLRFDTTGSERMRIDSSGNVGIGTSSPTFKLVAANSGTDGGWMYSTGSVSVLGLGGYANAGDGAFQIRYDRGTGAITFNGGQRDTPAARMTFDTSGNVGIGTASPASKLSVSNSASVQIQATTGTVDFRLQSIDANSAGYSGTVSNHAYVLTTNNAERMRIDSSGNVGIGTASPTANLEVGGSGNKTLRVGTTSNSYAYLNLNTWALDRAQLRAEAANPSAGSGTGAGKLTIWTANAGSLVERMAIDGAGNVIAGGSVALATTATDGFLYVPTCAGTPTGTPTAITGMAPIVVNTTNNKLYFYSGGAWRDAGP